MRHVLTAASGLGLPALLACLLCGCVGSPAPESLSAIDVLERIERQQQAAAQVPRALSLAQAKSIALQRNPDLKAAQARVLQAQARLKQARALYYPALSVGLGGTYVKQQADLDIPGGVEDQQATYNGGLEAYWLLFNGLSREYSVLAARHGVDAGKQQQRDVQRILVNAVAQAYLGALLRQSLMETAAADAAFNKQLLDEILKRKKFDKASRADELNFRIQYNQARGAYLVSRQNNRLARIALAELMGLKNVDLPEDVKLQEPKLPPATVRSLAAALRKAMQRPDMTALAHQTEAARATAKARFGDLFPTLAATGTYGATRLDNPRFDDDDMNVIIGVMAEWDLDLGGAKRNAYREAVAALRESEARLEKQRNGVVNELRSILYKLEIGREQLTLRRETVKLSVEQRDLTQKSYLLGKTSVTRLNEVQTALVRAQSLLAGDRIQLLLALEDLKAATGENLPE